MPTMDTVKMDAAHWRELCQRIFTAWGAPVDIAACVADSLVDSNLAGIDSHGVARIGAYYTYVKPGWWRPAARPEVARESLVTALVDGQWGFGQPAAHLGLEVGMAKAREHGLAAVGVIQAGHIGRLGEYAEKAAGAGMVVLLAASNARYGGVAAPHGGAARVFSTNPIAAGVPAREHTPFVMDFATTVVAAGRIELAPDKDMAIPQGWAIDAEGRPATTARQFLEGGALLPFANHKGYALSLLVELMCGALTGAGVTERPAKNPSGGLGFAGNATFLIVLDVAHLTDADRFYADVDGLFDRLKAVRPAPGFERVVIPGEPEAAQREKRLQEGIAVDRRIWNGIVEIATESGASLAGIQP